MLPNLQYLFLHSKSFRISSPVDFNVFSSLKQLVGLALSGIPLSTANITSDSDFSSQFRYVYLSGCNITEFPEFIRDQRNLDSLDLSNNNIKGQLPDWLWRLEELQVVKLSNNSLSDLSNNNFHGYIPRCLGTNMSSLTDLNLRNNSFRGSLPDMFMHASKLRSIDVSHNRLEGKLPSSLTGCSALEVLNVEGNKISDTFPFQLNSLQKLQVLVLRSNKFHGKLHQYNGAWFGFPELKIIDEYQWHWSELHVLNLSRNAFTGHIPLSLVNLTALESLDLSQNKLSGTQFQRQNCSAYEGNPGLYGPSLKDICGDIHAPTSLPVSEEEEEEEEEEESLSWIAARIGFAPGIVFGLTIGHIVASYKHEWFMKIFGRNKHSFTHRSHSPKH
ncbi:BnaA07g02940D [Brassica napus]|uniref:BnaA07g02940D protein n=1 Tax=Brassica napus TaxID=3708 RepID=A0A078GGA8_BRANA|nr:BnaA07g02940D [Brassica napus]